MLQSVMAKAMEAEQLRLKFLEVLRSRRSEVALSVEAAEPVKDPLYQNATGRTSYEAMKSCPKRDIDNFKELLTEENLYLITEGGEQGRLPLLILSTKGYGETKKPVVVFMHSSYKCKEWLRPLLEAYVTRGYIAVAVDSRYHGKRADSTTSYTDALVSAWKNGNTMPFIFDTVWDLIKLADYLTQREDVDSTKIGITGESLGGMHSWFAAAVDIRYSVAVPIIGIQGFQWAIENDKWHARIDSIKPVFEEARIDLRKGEIDADVVQRVWDRIAPGLASWFDAIYTIPAIAPRPLLIINGECDPRCPVDGLKLVESESRKAYEGACYPENFKIMIEAGIGHEMTPFMVKAASDWFDRFLLVHEGFGI